jgi:hypothetical protein
MRNTLTIGFLLGATALHAQSPVVISDFTTLPSGVNFTGGVGTWKNGATDQFTVTAGVLTVGPVSGGSPTNTGYFGFANLDGPGFNATGLTLLSATARLDSGNAAPGFIINLFDGTGSGALTATFSAGNFNTISFATASVIVTAHPNGGNISDIQSFGIAGSGTNENFRISFDNVSLAAIPEPATSAAVAGLSAAGLVAWRRRRATQHRPSNASR